MENLLIKSNRKIQNVPTRFERFLLSEINFNHRLIAIKGARGTGKTTLLLQHAKKNLPKNNSVLYVAMDDLFFYKSNLYELVEDFVKNNGKYLLLDEVHKYPDWSRELKLIYDDFPDLRIVFTSSSILNIFKAESDLSRRAISYILPELSLREFIELESGMKLPVFPLDEILKLHQEMALDINKQIKPIFEYNKYSKYGQYPYFLEGIEEYGQKLMATVNLILEIDLKAIEDLEYNHIVKLKKLLYTIATSVPFIPNISKLSEKIEISRPFMIKALNLLEKAQLLKQVHKKNKGISNLTKPDKLYLNNSNLIFLLGNEHAETGNIRETFFINQLSVKHELKLPASGDFEIDGRYIFEIGGKNKKQKQIQNIENSYLVKDNIEQGVNNTIPLWLFGFLY